jgi:nucleoside-triphosphatase
VLAHKDSDSPVRVGRYGVDVAAFERVGLAALGLAALGRAAEQHGVVVIDEIARMELASPAFADAVRQIMDGGSPVVATVQEHHHPFTDALKRRPDVELFHLTADNRDAAPGQLLTRLTR